MDFSPCHRFNPAVLRSAAGAWGAGMPRLAMIAIARSIGMCAIPARWSTQP
jgi:hypothetical protein